MLCRLPLYTMHFAAKPPSALVTSPAPIAWCPDCSSAPVTCLPWKRRRAQVNVLNDVEKSTLIGYFDASLRKWFDTGASQIYLQVYNRTREYRALDSFFLRHHQTTHFVCLTIQQLLHCAIQFLNNHSSTAPSLFNPHSEQPTNTFPPTRNSRKMSNSNLESGSRASKRPDRTIEEATQLLNEWLNIANDYDVFLEHYDAADLDINREFLLAEFPFPRRASTGSRRNQTATRYYSSRNYRPEEPKYYSLQV